MAVKLLVQGNALLENLRKIRQMTDKTIILVMKDDGYGMGFANVLPLLQRAGMTRIALSTPEEALAARALGWNEKILLLSPCYCVKTNCELLANRITLMLESNEQG